MSVFVEIQLLGRFCVRRGGAEVPPTAFGGRLARSLVRLMLVRRGEFIPRELMIEALWKDRPPADAPGNLSALVNRARLALGEPGLIARGSSGYRFETAEHCLVDAEQFLAGVQKGSTDLSAGNPAAGLRAFRGALRGWGGEPLPEDLYEDWSSEYRSRMWRAWLQAVENGATASLSVGDPSSAVELASLAVAREPLREQSNLLLVRSLAAAGDIAAALEAFEVFRAQLAEELGLDPSEEILELHTMLVQGLLTATPRTAEPVKRSTNFEELPFVGREQELQLIRAVLSDSLRGAVLVEGPAGTGKSRLLAELVGGVSIPAISVRAFLPEQTESWAVARTLLSEALTLDVDAVRAIPGVYAQALSEVLPELWEFQKNSASLEAHSRRNLALQGAHLLMRSVASGGLAVIVDDLQWADATSLSFLGMLMRRAPEIRLVLAYRPEELDVEGPVKAMVTEAAESGHPAQRISLGALTSSALRQVIADEALCDAILEETDGTPFSVTEVIRSLSIRGAVQPDRPGRFRIESPDAVALARQAAAAGRREAIKARVEAQPPGRRQLLYALSVLGREVSARVLARVIDEEQSAILTRLEALARLALVRLGDRGWGLAHDLISETISGVLETPGKGRIHLAVARALEEEGVDSAEVADHLRGAGDLAGAALMLVRASSESLDRFAADEAEQRATSGLALNPNQDVRCRLLEMRAEALARQGRFDRAGVDLQSALALAEAGPHRSRLLTRVAILKSGRDDYRRADQLIELALTEAGSDPSARAHALAAGARIDLNLNLLDRAEGRALEASSLFQSLGDSFGVTDLLETRAVIVAHLGRVREASVMFKAVADLYEDAGNLLRAGMPRSNHGNSLMVMGDAEGGLAEIDRALELETSVQSQEGRVYCLWHRSEALASLGRFEEAYESAEESLELARGLEHREWSAAALKGLGFVSLAAGDLDRAESAFKECLELAAHLPIFASWAASGLALVLGARGKPNEAGPYVQKALASGTPLTHYEARSAQAQIAAAGGAEDFPALAAWALEKAEAGGHLASAASLRALESERR